MRRIRGRTSRTPGALARRAMLALALVWSLLLPGPTARAHFDPDSSYGKNDYLYGERTLCYRLWGAMEDSAGWPAWIQQATDAWNGVSAQTDWSFRPCVGKERADVVFAFGKVQEGSAWSSAGTSFSEGEPNADWGSTAQSVAASRFCFVKIVEDVSGHQVGKTMVGKTAGAGGWGLADESPTSRTLDPVRVAMHELTHCMRMDHPPGALDTADNEDPTSAGLHGIKPISADDITQAHTAAVTGKPPQNVLPKPRTCVRDAADRDAIERALKAMLAAEQERLAAANAQVFGGGDAKLGYDEAHQATSNIEALQAALARLPKLPKCGEQSSAGQEAGAGHASAGPASSADGCKLAGALIEEINRVRAAPSDYAATLGHAPQSDATRAAIAYLQGRSPAPLLQVSAPLAAAAQAHALEQGAIGGVSHTGADGSTVMTRAQAQGVYATIFAEEIAIGQTTAAGAPADIVRQLIIDATSPTGQHRQDLLSPTLRFAGAGCAARKGGGTLYVIDLTNPPMAR